MSEQSFEPRPLLRAATGVPGLDTVLGGGMPLGGITILQGTPGAGKTILANQIAFHRVRNGGRVLYVTLLAETHGRLATYLQNLEFFDPSLIGDALQYLSGYQELAEGGTAGLLRLIGTELRRHRADFIVLDGLFVIDDACERENDFRRFINDLSVLAELTSSSVLLLTNSRRAPSSPEYTMADAWWELSRESIGSQSVRSFEVHKLRGSVFVEGRHTFGISSRGATVLPRLEAVLGVEAEDVASDHRLSTGLSSLDALIGGGLPSGSSTLVLGPPGIGKTTLGLHFAAQCSKDEHALILSFYETQPRLIAAARGRGIDIEPALEAGCLEVIWHAPTENRLDALGHEIVQRVRERNVRRLVIDGMQAFEQSTDAPERLTRFTSALVHELHRLGCASMFTAELRTLFGDEYAVPSNGLAAILDNVLLLRYVERQGQLERTFNVIKARDAAFDPRQRGFDIGGCGMLIADAEGGTSP